MDYFYAFYPPSLLETSTVQFCRFSTFDTCCVAQRRKWKYRIPPPCLATASSTPPADSVLAHMGCAPKPPPQQGWGMVCVTSPNLGRLCSHYSNELDFGVTFSRIQTRAPSVKTSLDPAVPNDFCCILSMLLL